MVQSNVIELRLSFLFYCLSIISLFCLSTLILIVISYRLLKCICPVILQRVYWRRRWCFLLDHQIYILGSESHVFPHKKTLGVLLLLIERLLCLLIFSQVIPACLCLLLQLGSTRYQIILATKHMLVVLP